MIRSFRVLLAILMVVAANPALHAEDAAQTTNRVIEQLNQNHPEALWQALPASYQKDVTELIHGFAGKMDPGMWESGFRLLNKLARVLGEKKAFIVANPMVSAQMDSRPGAADAYDATVRLMQILLSSEISSLSQLQTLDVDRFLAGTVSRIMQEMEDIKAVADSAGQVDQFKKLKATLVSSSGDQAVVRMEGDDEPVNRDFVRVEGKWIPADLAEEWQENIADARQRLSVMEEVDPSDPQYAQVQFGIAQVEGTLDQLLAAEDEAAFSSIVQGMMGMAMAMMASQAEGGENQQ